MSPKVTLFDDFSLYVLPMQVLGVIRFTNTWGPLNQYWLFQLLREIYRCCDAIAANVASVSQPRLDYIDSFARCVACRPSLIVQ